VIEGSFTYAHAKKPVFTRLNLSLDREEKVVLAGRNGSGKSTLARILMGLVSLNRGVCLLEGRPVRKYSRAQVGRKIGYVMQNADDMLLRPSVLDELLFVLKWHGYSPGESSLKAEDWLRRVELWDRRSEQPHLLSSGQRRLLAVTCVLAAEPEYLILDEPTVGLDAENRRRLLNLLQDFSAPSRGMLVITHDQGFAGMLGKRRIKLDELAEPQAC